MTVDAAGCSALLGHTQTLVVVTLLFIGYLLQFMTGFRRDRGVDPESTVLMTSNEAPAIESTTNKYVFDNYPEIGPNHYVPVRYYRPAVVVGENIFVYVVPSLLHFCGFVTALYAFRFVDNEHLQNLVERVSLETIDLFVDIKYLYCRYLFWPIDRCVYWGFYGCMWPAA